MKPSLLSLLLTAFYLAQQPDLVEMELMTNPEIHSAIHERGKTTALIYNGGTEQRGPQAVLGGHTLMARRTAAAIARRLGNALAGRSTEPGHCAFRCPPAGERVNEAVVASMVTNGFRNIVLMGDHGGGQAELDMLARALDARYAPKGVRVHFCGSVYRKARDDFNAWLKANGLPVSTHAGIPDTSEMMYLGGDAWVRKDKLAVGDGTNGISGDSRPSTPELGKRVFDMKVDYGVEEIRRLLAGTRH